MTERAGDAGRGTLVGVSGPLKSKFRVTAARERETAGDGGRASGLSIRLREAGLDAGTTAAPEESSESLSLSNGRISDSCRDLKLQS